MNLLDYQKSGNALGITVTPYPSFSLLDGLVPSVPGVLSFNSNFLTTYSYLSGDKLGSWLEATYGYKYDFCTYKGILLEIIDNPGGFLGGQNLGIALNNLESELDGFKHSLGSFMYATVPSNMQQVEAGSQGYYGTQTAGFMRQFVNPSLYPLYSPTFLYQLPKQYIDNINFNSIRFSTFTEEIGSFQPDGSPFYFSPSSEHRYRNGKTFTDFIGKDYGVFPYKRHQFVCLFGEIKDGSGDKDNPGFSIGLADFDDQYRLFCEMTKMNFLSMFHTYNSKMNSFNVYFPEEGVTHKMEYNMDPPITIKKRPFQTLFNYLGPGDLVAGGSIQTLKLQKYYDNYLTPNNILANIVASPFDENGKTYDKTIFTKQKEELYHIAKETFKRLEGQVFQDRSFQVEQDLEKFTETVNLSIGFGGSGGKKNTLPFKEKTYVFNSGIAFNAEEAISVSPAISAIRPLKAVVDSVYNYLSVPWEQATAKLPKGGEIYIPSIFIAEFLGGEALDGDGLPQVNPKFLEDFAHILENCLPDKSYDKLEALTDGFGGGKQTKVIFIPNEKYLQDLEDYKDAFPMYNEISFDIYPYAASEIGMILRKTNALSEILSSLVSYYYAPKAKYDIARMKTEMFVLLGEEFANLVERLATMSQLEILQQAPGDQARKGKSVLPFTMGDVSSATEGLDQFLSLINNKDNNLHYPDLFNNIIIDLGKYLENYIEQYIAILEGETLNNLTAPIKDTEALDGYGVYRVLGPPDAAAVSGAPVSNGELNAEFVGSIALICQEVIKKLSGIEEILSEKARYSEPFMYKIVKYDEEDNELQTIFIPHFSRENEFTAAKNPDLLGTKQTIKYIDTQVRYGKYYKYKVKQLRLVVGADYRYIFSTDLNTDYVADSLGYGQKLKDDLIMRAVSRDAHAAGTLLPDGTGISGVKSNFGFYSKTDDLDLETIKNVPQNLTVESNVGFSDSDHDYEEIANLPEEQGSFSREKLAIFQTLVYPNLSLVEVPFYEQASLVADFPPIPPNVNFDPLIGKGPTLLMTFENQTGDREEKPVLIEPDDELIFTYQKIAQKRLNSPSIRFKSDDFPKAYQIFVIDTPPENYQNFIGKMALQLDVQQATAIQQSLVPNKTYYFMFRTVDIHDNISNPSAVYAVQMTLDSGVYYPVVSIYNFQKKKVGTKSEGFKQYAKIEAAMIQKVVNQEASGISKSSSVIPDGHDLTLGIAGDSIWDQKKFKFRIKSKHTGKMIDLNVKFKNNYTEPPKGPNVC